MPDPDPKAQSMKVLAPTSARKQMVKAVKLYYHVLLLENVASTDATTGSQPNSTTNLPLESNFVRQLLPLVHRSICKRPSSVVMNYIITHARSTIEPDGPWAKSKMTQEEKELYIIFGPEEWAQYTVELVKIYQQATTPEQRYAATEKPNVECLWE